jgi:hypothetical protein
MAKYSSRTWKIHCPDEECEHEFKVSYSPAVPESGKWSYDPSNYDPGSGAEWFPEECPKCKRVLTEDDIIDGQ